MPIKDEIQNWEKSLNDIDQLYVEREKLRKFYDKLDFKMESYYKFKQNKTLAFFR